MLSFILSPLKTTLDRPGRHPPDHSKWCYIVRDYRSCCHYSTIAYIAAGDDNGLGSYPNIFTYDCFTRGRAAAENNRNSNFIKNMVVAGYHYSRPQH